MWLTKLSPRPVRLYRLARNHIASIANYCRKMRRSSSSVLFFRLQLWGGGMSVFQSLIFDTTVLDGVTDPAIRARVWAECFEQIVTGMDMGFSEGDARIIGTHKFLMTETVALGEMFSSSFIGARTKKHINRDDEDHVYLSFNIGATTHIGRQFGREIDVQPGQAGLLVLDASTQAIAPNNGHCISLKLPNAIFREWGLSPVDLACRPLDCTGADYQLLTGYARLLIANGAGLDEGGAAEATQHLIKLTGRWLGARDGVQGVDGEEAVYRARLALVRQTISKQAFDPEVSLERVARRLGMPSRTVQHMLAKAGESFSQVVMAARLRRARVHLLDPVYADLSVADIAFHCGFLDVSSFYRAFRAAYNVTPKSLREQAGTIPPE
ncbi:AraC family transcriptional regulator [Bradyrhizobium diazoefficiens]|nr:AraC family transcriptional regulator [Bradyrhizobium diazoefficiens]QLD42803.1 helix-turn-helix transcriptional regulator [Bradyrhizobium diazoefficiens]WLB35616.1 helix-turn-helix transcriptional regulator [Bradyrhizobium diazoefficiens]WLC19392.1 helix-turn-helix transcriptional regulator [Bradyrhizobium diazoefficiens]